MAAVGAGGTTFATLADVGAIVFGAKRALREGTALAMRVGAAAVASVAGGTISGADTGAAALAASIGAATITVGTEVTTAGLGAGEIALVVSTGGTAIPALCGRTNAVGAMGTMPRDGAGALAVRTGGDAISAICGMTIATGAMGTMAGDGGSARELTVFGGDGATAAIGGRAGAGSVDSVTGAGADTGLTFGVRAAATAAVFERDTAGEGTALG